MVESTVAGVSARGDAGWTCGVGVEGWRSGERGRASRIADMIVAGATLRGDAGGEGVLERTVDIAAGSVLAVDVRVVCGEAPVCVAAEEPEWMEDMRVAWMVVLGEVVWDVGGGGRRATEERLSIA